MPVYRIIRFASGGRIHSSCTIQELDDFPAIVSTMNCEAHLDCEIWRGDRLVARLPAAPQPSSREAMTGTLSIRTQRSDQKTSVTD
jgi:hypothetical protein